ALRVLVSDARGRRLPARGLAAWLRRVAPARARGIVNIALVSDAEIQSLNRRFRGVNHPTDVLSFVVARPFQGRGRPSAGQKGPLYGDIAIARGIARRQAREAGHSEHLEW